MNTMFEMLLQLPLFQGLAHEDFTNILEKVKLGFTKYKAGEVIVDAGDTCDKLIFVLKGEISSRFPFYGGSCSITEFCQAPFVIEPHSLFGMKTLFASTHTAQTEVHTLSVSKTFIVGEMLRYDIFRLNYINIIGNRVQNLSNRLWSVKAWNLESRIANFILTHCERPAGKKLLKMKMEELGCVLNDNRVAVSKALNNMRQKGLLELHRGGIVVPEAEKLIK